jgi:hypothetical protein
MKTKYLFGLILIIGILILSGCAKQQTIDNTDYPTIDVKLKNCEYQSWNENGIQKGRFFLVFKFTNLGDLRTRNNDNICLNFNGLHKSWGICYDVVESGKGGNPLKDRDVFEDPEWYVEVYPQKDFEYTLKYYLTDRSIPTYENDGKVMYVGNTRDCVISG